MNGVHYLLKRIIEGQQVLDQGEAGVPPGYIKAFIKEHESYRKGFAGAGIKHPKSKPADAVRNYLSENGEEKIRSGLRDILPYLEYFFRKGDSDSVRKIADVMDLIKNGTPRSPLLRAVAKIWAIYSPSIDGPINSSRLRDWIAAETGKEYPTNKITEAAKQIGLPLADGRGKGKRTNKAK